MQDLDCTGLACPEPVLRTKAALEGLSEGVITIRVDDPAARENVKRFCESQGCVVEVVEEGESWRIRAVRGYACEAPQAGAAEKTAIPPAALAFLVTTDSIGPERELGLLLLRSFLVTLKEASQPPARILLLNRGVLLAVEGSEAREVLQELESAGVEVLSCGTCLEFFGARERLRVGRVTNMYETVEALTGAYRTVTIA